MSIFLQHFRRSSKRARTYKVLVRGFTLIELLTVVSIMLIFTATLLVRQQSFDSSTLLRSLGYSVALSIRQAQVYGSSIRENTPGAFANNTAANAYGVHFTSPGTSYILFADANNDGKYTNGEGVQTFQINQGYNISAFCAVGVAATSCWTPSGACPSAYSSCTIATSLDIVFTRPNPEACFSTSVEALTSPAPCATGGTEKYISTYIQLVGPGGGTTRSITATQTGQISVGASNS